MIYLRLLPVLLLLYISSAPKGAFAQTNKKMTEVERAHELFYAKRYRKALRVLDQLLKKEPENYKAYMLQSLVYSGLEKTDKEEEALKKAVLYGSLVPDTYYRYGDFLWGSKRLPEARDLYKRGIQKLPKDAEMYHKLGYILDQMKDYAGALAAYNKAIALKPNINGTYYQRGTTYEVFKMYKKALADYSQAIALSPSPLRFSTRAMLRFKLGDYDGALADYQAEARLDTTSTFDLKAYRQSAFTSSKFAYNEWRDKDLAKAQKYGKEALKWADDPDEKAYLIERMKQDAQKLKDAPLFAQAQSLHQQGLERLKEKKYREAYELFKKADAVIENTAYELDPLTDQLSALRKQCLKALRKKK